MQHKIKRPTVKSVRVSLEIYDDTITEDRQFKDPNAIAKRVLDEVEKVRAGYKKTFEVGAWIRDTNLPFIINGVVNGITKSHMRAGREIMFWLSLEAAGVFTREQQIEWLAESPATIKMRVAEAVLRYMADPAHYEDDVMQILSNVDLDGHPTGRFFKSSRVYTILNLTNAIPVTDGSAIMDMCIEDMTLYQQRIESGVGTLKDKKGKALTKKEGKRLIDAVKASIKNAKKDGWYETLNKTKVFNISYVPEAWTSIQ